MARRKYRALRITGWIITSFVALILLVTLLFYLGRGWILGRALNYLNDQQPGKIEVGQINLIPFKNFPDVSLQLRNVQFFESGNGTDSLLREPFLYLNGFSITLDLIDLIRGDILVSEAGMKEGFIRLEIYADSVWNLENALGFRWDQGTDQDTVELFPAIKVDLKEIMLTDILLVFDDNVRDHQVELGVNSLESSFSYYPELLEAGVQLDVDINRVKYLTYNDEKVRNLYLETEATLDPQLQRLDLKPSLMRISGLEMETWGSYDYRNGPMMDLAFRASNQGLELLNLIFRGVLDLDEIEQIGSGNIHLSGTVNGPLKDALPVLRLNGEAERIGFRIKSIQKDVTDISFRIYATNGGKLDLSEGIILVDGFTATFPEGMINANMSARNFKEPEVKIKLDGGLELEGIEQMLQADAIRGLKGHLRLDGELEGIFSAENGSIRNQGGVLRASLTDIGFNLKRDSALVDSIRHLNGNIYMNDTRLEASDLGFEFNSDTIEIDATLENLIPYVLGMDRDVSATVSLEAGVLHPASLLHDTAISAMLGSEIGGLRFNAGLSISKEELDALIRHDSLPSFSLSVDSFGVQLPVYAGISDLNTSLTVRQDRLQLEYLRGKVGESDIELYGALDGYRGLLGKDSLTDLGLAFHLTSELLRAEDLLTFKGRSLLPEDYRTEILSGLQLDGVMELPVNGLKGDSTTLDFTLDMDTMAWGMRYYPHRFEDFRLKIRRQGEVLTVDHLEGRIGESDLKLSATVQNFTDSLVENLSGDLVLESDLLDIDELLKYQLPAATEEITLSADTGVKLPPRLDLISYPNFQFNLAVGELRYADYTLYKLEGRLRSSSQRLFYIDRVAISNVSGGVFAFNGQLNVSDASMYTLSAEFNLKDINVRDLDFEMQSGEETYTLKENFQGKVTADGLAEIFITPDLKLDVSTTTAMFNVKITDGALINFTPLQATAKYLDNKDLNHVRFASLYNSFTLTDSRIHIPLMNVESTIGQLLIEGEQGLDNTYLYLLRLPNWLVRGAARSRLGGTDEELEEAQIYEMRSGSFMRLTVWGDGQESEVRLGDRRDRYLQTGNN